MKSQKYTVKLTIEERKELQKFIKSQSKKVTEKCKTRAKVILNLDINGDEPLTPKQTAKKCKLHTENVYLIRKQYLTKGLDRITNRKKRQTPPVEPKVTGEIEAHIIATACTEPPKGKSRWTMQLIADKIILDNVIDNISDTTIQRTLKKRNISLI
jgi:hypothetical protein